MDDLFERDPEAKASFDRRRAIAQQRQGTFDAMGLPELREAAIAELPSAAVAVTDSERSATAPSDWIAKNRRTLASQILEMVENIDQDTGTFDMGKWFDLFSIEEPGQEELQTVAHEAVAVYNEYLRRRSS